MKCFSYNSLILLLTALFPFVFNLFPHILFSLEGTVAFRPALWSNKERFWWLLFSLLNYFKLKWKTEGVDINGFSFEFNCLHWEWVLKVLIWALMHCSSAENVCPGHTATGNAHPALATVHVVVYLWLALFLCFTGLILFSACTFCFSATFCL